MHNLTYFCWAYISNLIYRNPPTHTLPNIYNQWCCHWNFMVCIPTVLHTIWLHAHPPSLQLYKDIHQYHSPVSHQILTTQLHTTPLHTIPYQYHTTTPVPYQYHNSSIPVPLTTPVSHQYHTSTAQVPFHYHTSTTLVPHQYYINITPQHQYNTSTTLAPYQYHTRAT